MDASKANATPNRREKNKKWSRVSPNNKSYIAIKYVMKQTFPTESREQKKNEEWVK